MKKTRFAMSVVLLSLLSPLASAQPMGIIPPAGQPLPEIRLPSTDGKLETTRDLLGKRYVLHVFASW